MCLALTESATRGVRYDDARHLRLIDRTLVSLLRGDLPDLLIIEAPPRHGKSELISKYLPAWFLGWNPTKRVILASYAEKIAKGFGRSTREILRNVGGWFPNWQGLKGDVDAAGEWETRAGGGMVAIGRGGGATGRGADLLILDDLISDSDEALSATVRDGIWDWLQSTALRRLEPGGKVVLMATRWHDEDPTGRVRGASNVAGAASIPHSVLTLRAISEDADDPLGRKVGEALWPERWSIEELRKTEAATDAYWWSAMYQQRCGQHGRTEWPKEYFEEPFWADDWPDTFEASAIALDPSKGKQTSDFAAIVFVGLARGLLWIDSIIDRFPVPRLCDETVRLFVETGATVVGLEENAFQFLIADPLERSQRETPGCPPLPIALVNNSVDKPTRIGRIGPYLNRHALRFRRTPGNVVLARQLRGFPHAKFDDGPDALEQGIRLLNEVV